MSYAGGFGTRTTNTMQEGLRKILAMVAQLAVLPDADLEFLTTLQKTLVDKMRGDDAQQAMEQFGPQNTTGADMGPGPAMPPPLPPTGPPVPAPANGPMPGLTPGAPNMDEIARMLGPAMRTQ